MDILTIFFWSMNKGYLSIYLYLLQFLSLKSCSFHCIACSHFFVKLFINIFLIWCYCEWDRVFVQIFCCEYTETQLISVHWFYVVQLYLICWLVQFYGWLSGIFYTKKICHLQKVIIFILPFWFGSFDSFVLPSCSSKNF